MMALHALEHEQMEKALRTRQFKREVAGGNGKDTEKGPSGGSWHQKELAVGQSNYTRLSLDVQPDTEVDEGELASSLDDLKKMSHACKSFTMPGLQCLEPKLSGHLASFKPSIAPPCLSGITPEDQALRDKEVAAAREQWHHQRQQQHHQHLSQHAVSRDSTPAPSIAGSHHSGKKEHANEEVIVKSKKGRRSLCLPQYLRGGRSKSGPLTAYESDLSPGHGTDSSVTNMNGHVGHQQQEHALRYADHSHPPRSSALPPLDHPSLSPSPSSSTTPSPHPLDRHPTSHSLRTSSPHPTLLPPLSPSASQGVSPDLTAHIMPPSPFAPPPQRELQHSSSSKRSCRHVSLDLPAESAHKQSVSPPHKLSPLSKSTSAKNMGSFGNRYSNLRVLTQEEGSDRPLPGYARISEPYSSTTPTGSPRGTFLTAPGLLQSRGSDKSRASEDSAVMDLDGSPATTDREGSDHWKSGTKATFGVAAKERLQAVQAQQHRSIAKQQQQQQQQQHQDEQQDEHQNSDELHPEQQGHVQEGLQQEHTSSGPSGLEQTASSTSEVLHDSSSPSDSVGGVPSAFLRASASAATNSSTTQPSFTQKKKSPGATQLPHPSALNRSKGALHAFFSGQRADVTRLDKDTYMRKLEVDSSGPSVGHNSFGKKKVGGHGGHGHGQGHGGHGHGQGHKDATPHDHEASHTVLRERGMGLEQMLQQLGRDDAELEALKNVSRSAKRKPSVMGLPSWH